MGLLGTGIFEFFKDIQTYDSTKNCTNKGGGDGVSFLRVTVLTHFIKIIIALSPHFKHATKRYSQHSRQEGGGEGREGHFKATSKMKLP